MAWLSDGFEVTESISIPFTQTATALGPEWTLLLGTQTPRDIAVQSNLVWEPTTATVAPLVGYNLKSFPRDMTDFRASWGAVYATAAAPSRAARLHFLAGTGGLPIAASRAIIQLIPASSLFSMNWAGNTQTVAFTYTANVFFRMGFEVLDGRVRGYLSRTTGAINQTEAGNTALEVFTDVPYTIPIDTDALYIGMSFAGTAPSAANFNGGDGILVERFKRPVYDGSFPSGSYFEVPDYEVYQVHKTTRYLRQLLTYARVE